MPRINRSTAMLISICTSIFMIWLCSMNISYERPLSLFFQDWHILQDLRAEVDNRLKRENADMSPSDIRVTLVWSNADDLDLIVKSPDGSTVDFSNKHVSGMSLDVDMNVSNPVTNPIENVRVDQGSATIGSYEIRVDQYRRRGAIRETPFLLKVTVRGQERYIEASVTEGKDFVTQASY
jgi:hypothetical protein